jgi:hypothetical protein
MLHTAPDQITAERLAPDAVPAVAAAILVLENVSLSFGGVQALTSVDLAVIRTPGQPRSWRRHSPRCEPNKNGLLPFPVAIRWQLPYVVNLSP